MDATRPAVDVLLMVPFQPLSAHVIDPTVRHTLGAHFGAPLGRAMAEFEQFLGHPLSFLHWTDHPLFQSEEASFAFRAHRSLTAVALATHLEREGLNWAAIDPGTQELVYWRRYLERLRRRPPRVVALSTTFVISASWLKALCALVRRILPQSKIVVGGPFYVTSARHFFSLDADVFCLGEGDVRLPQIVRSIRDGGPLDEIPGLYYRLADGTLKYTGPVAPLNLDQLAPADWTLAGRIEPPIDLRRQSSYYYLETQRGCAFRCEFCTYHTLTPHELMSADGAAEAILRTRPFAPGYIFLVDATATYPRKRWEEILTRLAERGGSPHPILAFARVSDISEPIAELMARAGVQEVYVGQESGDQRMLDAMRKGTRVEHVAAAVSAMGKHGIGGQFCFIHGFPGETAESLRATRAMILTLNEQFAARPVVYTYGLTPFLVFDFASVARRKELQEVRHPMGYELPGLSPQRASEEVLATLIASSRVAHAPVCSFLFEGQAHFLFTISNGPRRTEIFRWLKALERGITIFLESDLEGTRPDPGELRRVRDTILGDYPAASRWRSAVFRATAGLRARLMRRLQAEWVVERQCGPGWLTRTLIASSAYRDLKRFGDALAAWRTGAYPDLGSSLGPDSTAVEELSSRLILQGLR